MRATQLTAADCVGLVYDTFLAMLRVLNIFVLALCSFLYFKKKKGLYAPPGTRHAPHKKKCRKCGKMVDEHDARTCKKGIGEALASLHHHHRHIVTHPLQPFKIRCVVYRFGVYLAYALQLYTGRCGISNHMQIQILHDGCDPAGYVHFQPPTALHALYNSAPTGARPRCY